ncbi:Uma2 family endonuclease [Alkalihalobacillus oceani]|uniref:Uma2 family endonuclease n=1 Tax=Halalkalibacter oceani TaxID=1653776 RepID=A0A9X2IP26_9BACI|nr:Uma2 family endonuclease [Halalkalibacter oceani]MCM3714411.1 Uma2 family endonuclease [Halalkalibacter oceani]
MTKKKPQPVRIKENNWTIDEYYRLPEDGNQYEIINGVLEMKPSPSTTHQRISHKLERTLTDSCESEYIIFDAPIDVVLSEKETRQPDILLIHRSREHIIEEHAIVGPPDLVIEIISPSTAKQDRTEKLESYASFGVAEYWIADHANLTIEQYGLRKEESRYQLLNFFAQDDTVFSERIACASFVVKDVLTIKKSRGGSS